MSSPIQPIIEFPCVHCSKSFPTATQVKRHMRTHLRENPNFSKSFRCDFDGCTKSFYTKDSLRDHKYRTHTCPKRFSCDFLNSAGIFKIKSALKVHKVKHTGERKFKCLQPECGRYFITNEHMKLHHASVHVGDKLFRCETCDKRFCTKINLNQHIKRVHIVSAHMGEKLFRCETCAKAYFTRGHLTRHISSVHTKTELQVKCPLCERIIKNKSNLNRHIASHLGEKPFSCGKCHREFGTSSILDAHQAAHQTEALFQCQLCPKKYKYQSDRKMHMNLIHPSTPHKSTDCHKCGKTFPNNIAVKKHLRLNHGNNTFFCYFCPKRVSNYKVSFEIHVRRHTLEKPFVCREDGCSYSSGSPSDLICHGKWTHKPKIEEETEICYFCGEKILKNDHAVLSHVNKHTMEKAFGCGVCGKLFYGKVEKVQKHIDEKHSRGRRKT